MTTRPSLEEGRPGFLRLEATLAWRVLLLAAAGLLAIWLVLQVTVIAVAAFLGFAQAAVLWPLVQRLDRYVPRALAALVVVLAYAAAVAAIGWFILREMFAAWPQLSSALVGSIAAVNDWFVERGWTIPPGLADTLQSELTSRLGQLASGIGGAALSTLSALGSAGTILVVGLFATVFALIGGEKMTQGVVAHVPASRQLSAFAALREAARTAGWWGIASAATGAVDGILIGAGMAMLGVPLAVPIGIATFVLAFVPMIGATIAGAAAVAVALFFGGFSTAVWTLLLVLAVQQIEGNVLSPVLLSRAMQFPPLLTLLLSTGAGIALGLPGLFLAVPVTGILVAAVKAWRRELPEDVRAARGIVEHPRPGFSELSRRVAEREREREQAREEDPGGDDGPPHDEDPDQDQPRPDR